MYIEICLSMALKMKKNEILEDENNCRTQECGATDGRHLESHSIVRKGTNGLGSKPRDFRQTVTSEAEHSSCIVWNLSEPGSRRLYRLGVSQPQKAKVSGDEHPRLRVS